MRKQLKTHGQKENETFKTFFFKTLKQKKPSK